MCKRDALRDGVACCRGLVFGGVRYLQREQDGKKRHGCLDTVPRRSASTGPVSLERAAREGGNRVDEAQRAIGTVLF